MKLTENTALLLIVFILVLVIFGGYTLWSGYIDPFLRKKRFLQTKIQHAPNEEEAMFWQSELKNYYKEQIPVLRYFIKK